MNRLLSKVLIAAAAAPWVISVAHAQTEMPERGGLAAALGAIPRDMSPWGMFLSADEVVKAVMIGLFVASIITWTVLLAKGIEVWMAKRKAQTALVVLAKARTLSQAAE